VDSAVTRSSSGESLSHADATTRRAAAIEGARDITPMVIGVIPLAIAIGVVMSASNLSTPQAILSGPTILAGTSQLAALELLAADVAPPVIVLSALTLNLRILLYGAAFSPWFERERLRTRLLIAIPIIDQLFFTCIPRFERGGLDARGRRAYHFGAGIWLYGIWWVTQLTAYALGPRLGGTADSIAVLAPLALVGLVARSATDRSTSAAAGVAALVAAAARGIPFNGALPLATLVGIAVGSFCATHEEGAS
jgi:predicted branched-subunit amino acid permease